VASSLAVTFILIKVRDNDDKYGLLYDLLVAVYGITLSTFLPALIYFWKLVLLFYMKIRKGTVGPEIDETLNVAFITSTDDQQQQQQQQHP